MKLSFIDYQKTARETAIYKLKVIKSVNSILNFI